MAARKATREREREGDDLSPAHPLERLIFFSDAVFAIAITLLVIEVRPPHLPFHTSDRDQLVSLINLTPSFTAFFISFFVVGAFFSARRHHAHRNTARSACPSTGRRRCCFPRS